MRLRSTKPQGGELAPTTRNPGRRIGEVLSMDLGAAGLGQRHAAGARMFGETTTGDLPEVREESDQQQSFPLLEDGDPRVHPLVVSAFQPADPLSRAVRGLRSAITEAWRPDGARLQSVAILGEGAAAESVIVAANLAVSCAQAGYRTLLIDANLNHAQQHNLFRVPNLSGLSTLLSLSEGMVGAPVATAIPLLSLLPAGPQVPNAPELLDRQRLSNLLDQLLDRYDFILVDVSYAEEEGPTAAFGLDGAIITLRRDISSSASVQMTAARLQQQGTAVLGTILAE